MSDQNETDAAGSAATVASGAADTDAGKTNASNADGGGVPEFQELNAQNVAGGGRFELQRFGGVQVVVTAELGRTKVTIGELMSLSEGAIIELNREISAPVELVAQGVPLGNGEVVVVDDRFAIRIKQIYQV